MLGLGMGQVGQVIAPAGTYKSWDRVYAMPSWARLQHLPVTAGGPTSTCKTQDLVGELWGPPWCATPPNDMCESQDCGHTKLGKAVAPTDVHASRVCGWARLG